MNINIDYDKALKLLNKAVEDKGADHIGRLGEKGGCSYYAYDPEYDPEPPTSTCFTPFRQEDGRAVPSCIVGHVVDYLGFDAYNLGEGSVEDILLHDGILPGRNADDERIELTEQATALLMMAQSWQDYGVVWGNAVKLAAAGIDYDSSDTNGDLEGWVAAKVAELDNA